MTLVGPLAVGRCRVTAMLPNASLKSYCANTKVLFIDMLIVLKALYQMQQTASIH